MDEIRTSRCSSTCQINFAKAHGGVLTQAFLNNLPEDWKNCNPVIDSRVHMLMPGMASLPSLGSTTTTSSHHPNKSSLMNDP